MNKTDLFAKVLSKLESNLALLVESAFAAKEASTNEESKAENKYDTRGLEASYLAAGQAQRAQKHQEQIYILKKVVIKTFDSETPIGVSALVELRVNEANSKFVFLLPVGGVDVEHEKVKVQTLTFDAPLGQQLLGMKQGESFEINKNLYEIIQVT